MNGWLGLVQQGLSPCKKRQASLGARCGREGSYPPSPRADPGVRNYRTGLFKQSRIRNITLSAIPYSEVRPAIPALHVRTGFPVQATTACQPLPHTCTEPQVLCVNGSPVSEYYRLIRPPRVIGLPTWCFGLAYLFLEPLGSPKFLRVSLDTRHAFCEPRQTLGKLTKKTLSLCRLLGR